MLHPAPDSSRRHLDPCMRFSPTPFTAGIRPLPPRLERPWSNNGSVQVDQAKLIRDLEADPRPAPRTWPVMALGHHQDQAQQRVAPDLVEVSSRVPIPEIPGPPAQDAVDVLHDHLDWEQQPAPVGQLPDPVTGMLHRLVRGPAGKEPDLPMTC